MLNAILFCLLFILISCQGYIKINSADLALVPGGSTFIDTTPPTVTINQAVNETVGTCTFTAVTEPTHFYDFSYRIYFSENINPTTFTTADITNVGTGGGTTLTWSLTNCGDDINFQLSATAVVGNGTIVPTMLAGTIQDMYANDNLASSSTDNSVDFFRGWYQEAYIKASNAETNDSFGNSVSVSGDLLAVGASAEASNETTITNGATASANNANVLSGAVYIFKRSGDTWTQEAYIKASNNNTSDGFGFKVTLHYDMLAVSASGEDSNQTTITNGATASADNSSSASGAVYIFTRAGGIWTQTAYIKAVNNNSTDFFGFRISLHDKTLAVGAYDEDSNQTTITNGATASADNSLGTSGAVYIYYYNAGWSQQAYIKAANAGGSDRLGHSVSLYKDTLAASAMGEDSNQTTITNGAAASADNTSFDSGATYIYKRTGVTWVQEAYLKAVNNGPSDQYGQAVSISDDTLAVGADGEDSNQTTITNGATASADDSFIQSGAVYIYKRVGAVWSQEAYIKASNNDAIDLFGNQLSLMGDTLAVSSPSDDSAQTTISNGPAAASSDNSIAAAGAVFVYRRTGTSWAQDAYIKPANPGSFDGYAAALSLHGDTIAVGAQNEDSNQVTITNGPTASADNSASSSGAVYVYRNKGYLYAPMDLRTTSITSSSLTLEWIKTGGLATGYLLAYQLGATAPADCTLGTVIDVGDDNYFTETALSSATAYSFRVCATDGTTIVSGATLTVTTN